MQICIIEIEQFDGYKFHLSSPFKNETDAIEFLKHYQCDNYKHINIKTLDASNENILFEIIKHLGLQYNKIFEQSNVISIK